MVGVGGFHILKICLCFVCIRDLLTIVCTFIVCLLDVLCSRTRVCLMCMSVCAKVLALYLLKRHFLFPGGRGWYWCVCVLIHVCMLIHAYVYVEPGDVRARVFVHVSIHEVEYVCMRMRMRVQRGAEHSFVW